MKQLIIFVFIAFCFISCSKDKTGLTGNELPNIENAPVKLLGAFTPTAGITVKGEAKMVSNGAVFAVVLDGFTINAGPDLKVYLSKKDTPFEFINLGPLKSLSGKQSYTVPAGTEFSTYKYVLIHCQQYNHLFAIAELKP